MESISRLGRSTKNLLNIIDILTDKGVTLVSNRNIVDRSNLVVCCIQNKSGGAYKTIQYAKKQGKKIVNVADENLI